MSSNHDQHRHFVAGCQVCQRQSRMKNNRRRGGIRNGTWQYRVDAAKPLAHLSALREAGMTIRAIAADSGVPVPTIRHVLRGRVKWVQGATAARLLALTCQPRPPAGFVSAVGSRRRVQALSALGYSIGEQAARLNRQKARVWEVAAGKYEWIRREHAEKIAALYDELSMIPGPSTYARNRARRNGWVSPLAWDDDQLDDPAAQPQAAPAADRDCAAEVDPAAVEKVLDGRAPILSMPVPVRVEVVRQLAGRGYDDATIAARTRYPATPGTAPWKSVAKLRGRHGIPAARPRPVAA